MRSHCFWPGTWKRRKLLMCTLQISQAHTCIVYTMYTRHDGKDVGCSLMVLAGDTRDADCVSCILSMYAHAPQCRQWKYIHNLTDELVKLTSIKGYELRLGFVCSW